ncbi:hypothetical protein HDR66_01825 [bacterium]|nr:hypothetical protein [bacterium]
MKNKSIVWMLAMVGLTGCIKDSKVVEVESDADKTVKTDTALVLHASPADLHSNATFLLVCKDGSVVETYHNHQFDKTDVYKYSAAGDTVLVAGARPDSVRIVRNLSMENKIKAFSRQK